MQFINFICRKVIPHPEVMVNSLHGWFMPVRNHYRNVPRLGFEPGRDKEPSGWTYNDLTTTLHDTATFSVTVFFTVRKTNAHIAINSCAMDDFN